MAIINTYGGKDANAYITHAEADSYITTAKIFFDEWTDATTVQREAAIMIAAKHINSRGWHGSRFFYYQMMEFPRVPPGVAFPYGVVNLTAPGSDFVQLTEHDEYQRRQKSRVQQANAEQALFALRQEGRSAHREDQFRGIRSQGRGVKFSESFGYGDPDVVLCPEAWDLLRYYKGAVTVLRGDTSTQSVLE